MIRWLFQFVLVLSLSIWVGSIVFFSAVVAPGVFMTLEKAEAGRLLSKLFPNYYLTGTLCGLAALGTLLLLLLFDSGARMQRLLQMALVALMLVGSLYAGAVLEGRIHRARDERTGAPTPVLREEAERRFASLHARSVKLNLAVLGLGVAALGTTATRRKPD